MRYDNLSFVTFLGSSRRGCVLACKVQGSMPTDFLVGEKKDVQDRHNRNETRSKQLVSGKETLGFVLDGDGSANAAVYACLLRRVGIGKALSEGKRIHARIINTGHEYNTYVGNLLVQMYGECGAVNDARCVFSQLRLPNAFSWGIMIGQCTHNGHAKEALQLFRQMQLEGLFPDRVILLNILGAFASQVALAEGQRMHVLLLSRGFQSHVIVRTAVVNMYGKCGNVENARRMFDRISERDVIAWNAMITAYTQNAHCKEALLLFHQMEQLGAKPNKVTFIIVLDACASEEALAEGMQLHIRAIYHGSDSDVILGTAMVNMYGKCGDLKDSRKVFDHMPARNVLSWNAMITVYAEHAHGKEALILFQQMQVEAALPDTITFINTLDACAMEASLAGGKWLHALIVGIGFETGVVLETALVNMYAKCGDVDGAQRVFDKIPDPDVVSWNAMIAAYAQQGKSKEAFQVYQRMQQGFVTPSRVTFINVLDACASCAALAEGRQTHNDIRKNEFESDVAVGTALVNMYAKCGDLEDARATFNKMPEKDIITWNAMLEAYAQYGEGKKAVSLFQQMQEAVIPDSITFVSVLSACSHAGLLEEGAYFFGSMSGDHSIMPTVEHYNCMIDLLGRVGRLDGVESLIKIMPFQPSVLTWMTILGACRVHLDIERGQHAAEQMFSIDAQNASPYVSLANIYAAAGRWDDAIKLRERRREWHCLIEVNDRVHLFQEEADWAVEVG